MCKGVLFMARVLKEYHIKIFSDGRMEKQEILKVDFNEILSKSSEKIKQAILVILQLKVLKEGEEAKGHNIDIDYSSLYNRAINLVADNLFVTRPTVRDKLERGMDKKADEMKKIIEDFFTRKNEDLKQVMLDSIKGKRKEKQDKRSIEELFDRLYI